MPQTARALRLNHHRHSQAAALPSQAARGRLSAFVLAVVGCFGVAGCSSHPYRPCSEGLATGDDAPVAAPSSHPFQGTKHCFQKQDEEGKLLNEGQYRELYPEDTLAVEGEYHLGKKTGRWITYDPAGNKVKDQYFLDGKPIPRP